MIIQYRREMNHNYMIVEPETRICTFELEMLLRNKIEGLLKLQVQNLNGESLLYYDITSRQPLSRILENKEISSAEIRPLISGILETVRRIEGYLLQENQLLLKPELIYIEPRDYRVYLCLLPGHEGDFRTDFCRLLQHLLGKTDHKDKESVVLMYGLYQESLKENCGADDIFRYLYSHGEHLDEEKESPDIQETPFEDMRVAEKAEVYHVPEEKPPFGWLRRMIKGEDGRKTDMAEQMPQFSANRVQEQELHRLFAETEVSQNSVSGYQQASQNTVLLTEYGAQESVRKLVSADKTTEDILLPYFPFVIGKQEHLADYVFSRDTISRMHARIDCIDGAYRVTDLNSTNGTRVRGKILENNEDADIYPGDEIHIAEYRFLFI